MIVFCTTCKGRTQHLRHTLPKNLADNLGNNCKFVVLDYGSKDDLLEYLQSAHTQEIASGKLVVYSHSTDAPFHMAHAKNMAHRLGMIEGGTILVNLDADGFTGPGFANFIQSEFETYGPNILLQAMWNRWVNRLWGTKQVWMAEDEKGVMGPPVPKGCNGRMVVTADAFLLSGGYNEKYDTWGPDDKDFNIRLRRLGFEPRIIPRAHLDTLHHNDKMRFREYPHVARSKHYEDFKITVHDSNETVVNWGRVGCGTVVRNPFAADAPKVQINPIPTRIFGIGMHKTATTSLSEALRILGYKSGHWESAHWAKRIWNEMTTEGKSKTLEQWYALSDLPIPLLYKELDAAYPGSKFILTVRRESNWIDSVRRHWNHEYNPYKEQWNSDPFTHKVHRLMYGQKGFDAELFLARYRKHNDDVREYFKDRRRTDLLEIDIEFNSQSSQWDGGWYWLCNFLGRELPNIPFPHVFASKRRRENEGAVANGSHI